MTGDRRMRDLGERRGSLEAWVILWQMLCSPYEHEEDEMEKEMREMNELKGFMDLGFDFSDLDRLSPRLKEVVPALKTMSCSSRPDPHERKQQSKVQSSKNGGSVNDDLMKYYLKKWARSVAIKAVTTF